MDAFDSIELAPQDIKKNYDRNPSKDAFDEIEVQESWGKNLLRTLYQIPSGIGQAFTYPLDLISMIGTAESYDPEEVEHLKMISEREGIPFDEEKYYNAIEAASQAFPTQGNIEKGIESYTGAPLTPKTKLQKGIKLAATAGMLQPGALLQKGIAAAIAPSVSQGLQSAGVPETLSEIGGLGIAGVAGAKTPKIDISKSKKPSGMTNLRYEKLKKPTSVSENRLSKINEKIEGEFRSLSDKIIADSPIAETFSELKKDMKFKEAARDALEQVEKLAENIPDKISTTDVLKEVDEVLKSKQGTGFLPSEYEKNYSKFIKEMKKETSVEDAFANDLVRQYRKNNRSFREINEPGQSYAYNQAKRDALRDYNIGIAKTIENKFPGTEFAKLFPETNERWSKIMDAETISEFLDDMFKGKINFKTGRDFFEKNGMSMPFERAMGKEGFSKFKVLLNDLMSTEQAAKLLKQAEKKGFSDLVSHAAPYIISPKLGAAKSTYSVLKEGFNSIFEMLLDKPQLAVTWDRGIKAMKAGNFKAAETELNKVKAAQVVFDKKESSRVDALKKFKEKKSQEAF